MRITPKVIRVRDFRSFNEEQVITLADEPGTLGLITGINQAEPDLGANGTGKSTVWDAMCWCLFGKTIRGQRGPAILPWGVDVATPRVQFTFEVESHLYTISRTANPNGIRLFREAVGPGALDYNLFLSTVVRGQFAESFLELTPKKKMDFLSAALVLDRWDTASIRASEAKKGAKARLEDASTASASCCGRLGALTEATALAREGHDRAVGQDMEAESARAAKRISAQDSLLVAQDRHQESLRSVEELAIEFAEQESRVACAKVGLSEMKPLLEDCQREHAAAIASHELAEEGVRDALKLQDSCPTCHSYLSKEDRQAALGRAEDKAALTDANLYLKQSLVEAIQVRVGGGEALLAAREGKLVEISDSSRRSELLEVELRGEVLRLEAEIESLDSQTNPHALKLKDHLIQMQARHQAADDEYRAACAEEKAAQEEFDTAGFWVKGFQDIRLWLLRSALDELEALANSHTLALGLRGWRILFDVERETKSGGIAKGFRCLIQSPTNTEPVPLESWSGGEIQRLKIATQAAMCDLIRSRFGGSMALEVWDEPGQHLSTRGCKDMMVFFRERAATLGIEVWVVDHRSTASGDFDQQLVVTRTASGTTVKRGLR
jgi:DNA repair exonuclease SbcCD ATPase subunit